MMPVALCYYEYNLPGDRDGSIFELIIFVHNDVLS